MVTRVYRRAGLLYVFHYTCIYHFICDLMRLLNALVESAFGARLAAKSKGPLELSLFDLYFCYSGSVL